MKVSEAVQCKGNVFQEDPQGEGELCLQGHAKLYSGIIPPLVLHFHLK